MKLPARIIMACTAPWLLLAGCAFSNGKDSDGKDSPAPLSCQALQGLASASATISTREVPAGEVMSGTLAMPAHCLVTGEIDPRTGVNGVHYGTRFELRLPKDWSGRFHFQGGGGVDGSVPQAIGSLRNGVQPSLSKGFAVVSSDMGHVGANGRDASFGLDPQARIDWGYASADKVTVLAKTLVTRHYGRAPHHSYFIGCSGGGRQALMMSQRFPAHFDGIVAGAPILEQHTAQIGSMQVLKEFSAIAPKDAEGRPVLSRAFSDEDLRLIAKQVLERCDALDGAADGIVENYPACKMDATPLQCAGAKTAGCLSTAQVGALNRVMSGPRNSAGVPLYPGIPWDPAIADWRANMLGTSTSAVPNAAKYTNQSIRYVFMTPPQPDFDYLAFDFDKDPATLLASAAITATNSTDYDAFRARNGRALVFVGLGDSLVNPAGVNRWYQNLMSRYGSQTQSFARLFNVPGMGHCSGGPALDVFDPVSAIVDWVENGRAPDGLMASGASFPGRTRTLCPYPKTAHYIGSGSVDAAASFVCQ